jgi:hypothetical protein
MAINQNHVSEDLNGVKCAVVEKNVSKERADFLRQLLTFNKYMVEIAATPRLKSRLQNPLQKERCLHPAAAPAPETYTVGVTDMMFNPINAIFGRILHSADGHVVTQAYWFQQEKTSHDEIPYYEKRLNIIKHIET